MSTIVEYVQRVKRAKLAYQQAKDALMAELPDDVQSEIHYNHSHARVDSQYEEAKKVLIREH